MKTIAYFLLGAAFLVLSFLVATKAASRSERLECQEWKKQSVEYRGWYATDWQLAQCRTYGIELTK